MTPPPRARGFKAVTVSSAPRDLIAPPRRAGAWTARVITLFPEAFPGVLGLSLTGKALEAGLWALEPIDLRRFGEGRHRNVDDTPAGGGAGMVLRADVLGRAIDEARIGTRPPGSRHADPQHPDTQPPGTPPPGATWPLVALSPRGRPFTQAMAQGWAQGPGVTLICGRFEGIDDRVLTHYGVEEVSLGDFVLTGGEIAAMALIDATVRLIPRVLGNHASVEEESFAAGLLEHPHYTKPAVWKGHAIPDILLSGHHAQIAGWRRAQAERLTQERRPDLWRAYRGRPAAGGDPGGDTEL